MKTSNRSQANRLLGLVYCSLTFLIAPHTSPAESGEASVSSADATTASAIGQTESAGKMYQRLKDADREEKKMREADKAMKQAEADGNAAEAEKQRGLKEKAKENRKAALEDALKHMKNMESFGDAGVKNAARGIQAKMNGKFSVANSVADQKVAKAFGLPQDSYQTRALSSQFGKTAAPTGFSQGMGQVMSISESIKSFGSSIFGGQVVNLEPTQK